MRAERQQNPEQDYVGKPHQNTTKQPASAKKEFVRHITKDLIRDLMSVHPHHSAAQRSAASTRDLHRFSSSVPEDLTCTSVIIDGSTYHRLAHAARFNPREVRDQELDEARQNRDSIEVSDRHLSGVAVVVDTDDNSLQAELDRRKKAMQEYDQQRKRNAPLDEIDQEAKEEAEYLLKRANELRQEQEDEVKHLNEVRLL